MKKIYTILSAVLLTASVLLPQQVNAQAPEKMSYQAVVRDASNNLVTTKALGMQISILQGSKTGSAVYVETQIPTTNANGLVTIEIGTGTVVSGDLSTINWANDIYFIKTETDPTGGTDYTITGTSQLLSVPYALHAKTAEIINETDPVYTGSQAVNITATDITNLSNLSGTNAGDQDISDIATNTQAIKDTASQIRADIPDVSGFISNETDPTYTNSQAVNITATDITNLSNLSGTNTGDQDVSDIATNMQAIKDTASQIRADIPDVSGFISNEIDSIYTNSQAVNITATDITNLSNLSGTNTGDQDVSDIATNTQAIKDTASQIRADIDVSGFISNETDPIYSEKFDLTNVSNNDLLKFDGTKFVKFTPNYLTSYTETQNLNDVLIQNNSAWNTNITNLADPVNDQDAATKTYVDAFKKQLYVQGALKLVDYDGNYYIIIKIGNQFWMAENLKVTHFPDGTSIPLVTVQTDWDNLPNNDADTAKAYCYFYNSTDNFAKYGALYTYAAAKDVCPTGWHLPSDAEWTELENYIANDGHSGAEGTALKSTTGWGSHNGTDDYGFSALPGGYRNGYNGVFLYEGTGGYWWSSTEYNGYDAWNRKLYAANVNRYVFNKSCGHSVRCVMN